MNKLKQKRKELGLTQIQAANACGVSRRTYQTYEENEVVNATFLELMKKIDEMGVLDGGNYISNIKHIKYVCRNLFLEKYPEIECAYLFGSYARGEANGQSYINILIVCQTMDVKLDEITFKLEEQLHKKVNLLTHRKLVKNEKLLRQILKEGIKIYR